MKTFVELITEVKRSIDQEDNKVLANIENSMESTTVATSNHALGSYLIYDKKVYEVTTPISVGDTLVIYPATDYNIKVADDIMTMIETLDAENQTLTNKLNNEIVTRSALGAKNILPFDLDDIKALNTNGTWAGNIYTYRGVDFTVNSDGTISATGTATGGNASIKIFAASSNYEMLGKEVILTGCPSNGSASTYRIQAYRMATADGSTGTYFDDGAGTDAFTVLNDASGTVGSFAVAVYENTTVTDLLFKPMVRLASDSDATYQPYAKTNKELTTENEVLTNEVSDISDEIADMNNVLGAKNLLPNNATSITKNGVTFTVNSDGSVTANGTASAYTQFDLNSGIEYKEGKYALNGCPSGGGSNTYVIWFRNLAVTVGVTDGGNGATLNVTNADTFKASIIVYSGATVNNLTFYPMLRPASIEDDTYEPYSMTNREMTPYVQAISNPNLLDNPWFTVNQRGQSSYNGTNIYTVDRWYIGRNTHTLTVENGYVKFERTSGTSYNPEFAQKLEKLTAGKYTLSVKYRTTSVVTDYGSGFALYLIYNNGSQQTVGPVYLPTANSWEIGTLNIELNSDVSDVVVRVQDMHVSLSSAEIGDEIDIACIKLELSEVSTLASDTAPNYATELTKCQRYYQCYKLKSNYAQLDNGRFNNDHEILMPLSLPTALRAQPTVRITNLSSLSVYSNNNDSISSITHGTSIYNSDDVVKVCLVVTTAGTNHTKGDTALIAGTGDVATAQPVIELSADL